MNSPIQLTDGIILLRPPDLIDLPVIHKAVRESMAELQPWMDWASDAYDETSTRRWFEHSQLGWRHSSSFQFIITDCASGQFFGECKVDGIDEQTKRCNIGYWIATNRTGQGIASRAVRIAARFAFQTLGLASAELVIASENPASQRVAQKTGAQFKGSLAKPMVVHTDLYDAVLYLLTPADLE